MTKLTTGIMIFIILSGTCTTQSMDTIDKKAPFRSHEKNTITNSENNCIRKVIIPLENPVNKLKFVPIKKRMSHTIADLVHGDTEPANQVTFDDFWRDINNQPAVLPLLATLSQNPKAAPATRKPRIANPAYEYIQRFIEEKVIDITCCSLTFTDFKALRLHICKKHQGTGRTHSAQLKDGSKVWYAQAELAASRMAVDHYTGFFLCPECNYADFSNTVCLKRHYEKCIAQD